MIPTLKVNNGASAALANIQIQPQSITSVGSQIRQQTSSVSQGVLATGVVPASQASIPVLTMTLDATNVAVLSKTSLADVVNKVGTDSSFIMPLVTPTATFNTIVPTYVPSLDLGRAFVPDRLRHAAVVKFQPYESLTGISQQRPEIIMLTDFLPLVDATGANNVMTSVGKYIDAQFTVAQTHISSTFSFILSLSTIGLRQIPVRKDEFSQALDNLKNDATFLLNLARIIETGKQYLDLRHDTYEVAPDNLGEYMIQNFVQQRPALGNIKLTDIVLETTGRWHKRTFSCVDTLHDLGYDQVTVQNVFASTKIWFQLVNELKLMLQHHSLRFLDIDPTAQRNDTNVSTILVPTTPKYFEPSPVVTPGLPKLFELVNTQVGGAPHVIASIESEFKSLYQNVFFKNEEARISALAHLLSQEYRYSYGIQRALANSTLSFYGVSLGTQPNVGIFDSILGVPGNNITDITSTNNSLMTVAQVVQGTTGVLSFESSYIEGDTGTLTPGGDYFYDRLLSTDGGKFDTSAIDAFSKQLDDQLNHLLIVTETFNLMMIPGRSSTNSRDIAVNALDTGLDVINSLLLNLVNTKTGDALQSVINDPLAAVYATARTNTRVKTLLFLHSMSRISRAYNVMISPLVSTMLTDNTPLTDWLANQIVAALESSIPTMPADQARSRPTNMIQSQLTSTNIQQALKAGTVLSQVVESFMSSVVNQFSRQTSAITDGATRYRGLLDTVVMMITFDLVVSIAARYGNQQFVGFSVNTNNGVKNFSVSQTTTNHSTSLSELTQRINGEMALTQQTLMSVVNVLLKLRDSLKGVSNYLNGTQAVTALREVAALLDNDVDMMRMLFSEQQIMLLASTVNSLTMAHDSPTSGVTQRSYNTTGTSTTDSSSEIVLLDEAIVPPAMHEALFGYFGNGDFASSEGLNKRIITVGIPLGFTQLLRHKVKIQEQKNASFETRRNDIVKLTIYKVDNQNPDIVYEPQRFLFEMSRFPVRFTTNAWLPLSQNPTLSDVISAIPTQRFSQDAVLGTDTSFINTGLEYASATLASSDGIKGSRQAFDDQSYDFLSAQQKSEILKNHIVSQLLEAYVKLLTGVNVSECSYDIAQPVSQQLDSTFTKALVAGALNYVAIAQSQQGGNSNAPSTGTLFSTTLKPAQATSFSKITGAAISTGPQSLTAASSQVAMTAIKSIDTMSRTLTSMSSVDALNERVFKPKQFDRVFNIIVDPRDFEIDMQKTLATPYGRQALNLLLQHGDVVSVLEGSQASDPNAGLLQVTMAEGMLSNRSFPQGGLPANVNNFRFRDRDKNQGDLTFDKYYITIETFDEDET